MEQGIPKTIAEVCDSLVRPTYVYDLGELRRSAGRLRDEFARVDALVLFATMANPRREILNTLASMEIGACVNSVSHLRAAVSAGMNRANIQFTSSGLPAQDIMELVSEGIQCNVDSRAQGAALLDAKPGAALGVRLNMRLLLGNALQSEDRLGSDPRDLPGFSSFVESRGGRINGAHIYVGTNFRDHLGMLPALDAFFRAAASLTKLDYVNVGGGIGVDYSRVNQTFDLRAYAHAVGGMLEDLRVRLRRPVRLIIEPGRAIVASAGYFACRVTDIKRLGGNTFVGVNASVSQFPRPWHHPETPHRVYRTRSILRPLGDDAISNVVITGCTTYSKDVLSIARLPEDLEIGESIIFTDAGAYCDSMASRFLGQLDAESVFID